MCLRKPEDLLHGRHKSRSAKTCARGETQNLLDFGVKEVIWFFSQTKQVFMAKPAQDWTISPWEKEIKILDQYALSLGKLLAQGGWKLEG
jgi:hypothetical protein